MGCSWCQKIGPFIVPLALVVGLLAILYTVVNVADDVVGEAASFVHS